MSDARRIKMWEKWKINSIVSRFSSHENPEKKMIMTVNDRWIWTPMCLNVFRPAVEHARNEAAALLLKLKVELPPFWPSHSASINFNWEHNSSTLFFNIYNWTMKSSNYKSHQLSVEKMRRRCRLSLTRMGQDSSIFSEDVENDPCCPNLPIRGMSVGLCNHISWCPQFSYINIHL